MMDRVTEPTPAPILRTLYELLATPPAEDVAFDPAGSPLHGRAVFIVGAPRSGTTWLHQLLATHPQVATAGESHIFCEGLGELFTNHEDTDPWMKLNTWLSRPRLTVLVRQLVDGILMSAMDRRPGATHVLDKTPNHAQHAARLAEVYPDATFVHIIRDGREAVASAHDLWSWSDDYREIGSVAARWRDAVTDVRDHLSRLHYIEVRYEALLADTERGLARVLDHIGLPYNAAFLAVVTAFGSTPINVRPSKSAVSVHKWGNLGPVGEAAVLVEAGDLLVELRYVSAADCAAVLGAAGAEPVRRVARRGLLRRRAAQLSEGNVAAVTAERAREQQRVARATGRAFSAALVNRDREALLATLVEDVELAVVGQDRMGGSGRVADALLERVVGLHEVTIDADEHAAAVRFASVDGTNRLYVCWPDRRGRIVKITVEG